jgi:serine/threonine protein kinase
LCEAGELSKWIKKRRSVNENHSRIIMKQIVDAIAYLHKQDIVHRDLKLENILLKEYDEEENLFCIRITDFGLSTQRETSGTDSMFDDFCGTPMYMAPEIIENYPYSQLCDVWALGIIMFILLTGQSPFTADNDVKLREQIRHADINRSLKSYNVLSPEAKDCIERMLKVNPARRITSSELSQHPWFLNKTLQEMQDKTKNVLELMAEMLHEQEQEQKEQQKSIENDTKNDDDLIPQSAISISKRNKSSSSFKSINSNNNNNNGDNYSESESCFDYNNNNNSADIVNSKHSKNDNNKFKTTTTTTATTRSSQKVCFVISNKINFNFN